MGCECMKEANAMNDRPVIVRTPRGETFGLASADMATKVYPDAVIISYQDGTPYEVAVTESKPVSKMNREELETHAITVGVVNPGDKELYPNVAALRDAVTGAESTDA